MAKEVIFRSTLRFLICFCSLLCLYLSIMPHVRHKRPITMHLTLNIALSPTLFGLEPFLCPAHLSPEPSPGSEPTPALAVPPKNKIILEFMQTCIKKVRDQVLTAPIIQAREEALDRPLKSGNPKLYYSHLHIECYYFY